METASLFRAAFLADPLASDGNPSRSPWSYRLPEGPQRSAARVRFDSGAAAAPHPTLRSDHGAVHARPRLIDRRADSALGCSTSLSSAAHLPLSKLLPDCFTPEWRRLQGELEARHSFREASRLPKHASIAVGDRGWQTATACARCICRWLHTY
jgi:hypothetical protein